MKIKLVASSALCLGMTAFAGVAPTIDGTAEALYGAPIAVQSLQTQFGNSDLGLVDWANGSEVDTGYAFISGGNLYVVVGGNVESNYNKIELFIDCKAGGQNKLRGDNRDVDFNGVNRMGDDGSGNGLTFDEGFTADYWVGATCGGPDFTLFANCTELLTDGGEGAGGYLGSAGAVAPVLGFNGIEVAINNSNVAGVAGGTQAGDGSGVTTGVEYKIPLSVLGYTEGTIKICAFINGGGHDFVSNQVLGSCPVDTGNLGEPRSVNFTSLGGDQFFVLGSVSNPCPADLNGDGEVNGADLGQMLGSWGPFPGPADLNGDGEVNGADLGQLLGTWGACP